MQLVDSSLTLTYVRRGHSYDTWLVRECGRSITQKSGSDLSTSSPLVLLELRILTNLTNKDYKKYQEVNHFTFVAHLEKFFCSYWQKWNFPFFIHCKDHIGCSNEPPITLYFETTVFKLLLANSYFVWENVSCMLCSTEKSKEWIYMMHFTFLWNNLIINFTLLLDG